MTRRSAFARPQAQEPVEQIPTAQKKRRAREWDKSHPTISYFIPAPLHGQAKDVRAEILGLAQKHMTTITSVAAALMEYALAQVRIGKLNLETRPDAMRRRIALTWEDANEKGQEIPRPVRRQKKDEDLYLGYRWSKDTHKQIESLSNSGTIVPGEVVVFLLRCALDAYKSGRLQLTEKPIVMRQEARPSWQ